MVKISKVSRESLIDELKKGINKSYSMDPPGDSDPETPCDTQLAIPQVFLL